MARIGRIGGLFAAFWSFLALAFALPAAAAEDPFSNWAAIVVAGDWHAHSGGPSEAFDNARRDVGQALEKAGFQPSNLREFSVRPERYKDAPLKSDPMAIFQTLSTLASKATDGCLIYFTSHGAPQGVVLDQGLMPPSMLATILDRACPNRPTVVVLSACFSGVFIPTLAKPNRMILTAARRDRTSFGCGEADKYPFFDDCFLQSMPKADDFPDLATDVQACVAKREIVEGMHPPSEPQLWIGPALRPMLPLLAFSGASPPAACAATRDPTAKAC
ncbi:C13 family peptidase [Phenylobacterium sp.]|uniref:C13 family peptidase n=1 Tax=Phenylobacterium sp. TaxID=1871053 RepID=UPI0035B26C98